MQDPPIGFDLGTSTSAVATIDGDGRPVLVPQAGGERLVPSVVYFDEEVRVGGEAREYRRFALDNYAEGFKRDIGKSQYRKRLRSHEVPPEVLTAFLVEHLAQGTRENVGDFNSIVVTVPAYFDERQRTATRRSVSLAGLETLEIINEPTAAAIAAGYQALAAGQVRSGHKILVYDLGGGTFDATLLEVDGRVFKTLGTDGEVYLGGHDFNERIVNLVAESFLAKHGIDPRTDPADSIALSYTARDAKHGLTEFQTVTLAFEHAGLQDEVSVHRSTFEEAIGPLIERSLMTCQATLADAGIGFSDVDDVLLVGGSSRVPLVRKRLEQESGRKIRVVDDPDELVAKGAALYAAVITDSPALPKESRFEVVNVNAHSLGIQGVDLQTKQPINKIMIPRNTPLPASSSMSFTTVRQAQPNVRVRLLEGESESPEYCTSLGQCLVQLPTSLVVGTAVNVTCRYDAGGTISVTARVPATQTEARVDWNREGFDQLEPLSVWRERLTISESTEPEGAAPSRPLARDSTLRSQSRTVDLINRLDQLYEHVAQKYHGHAAVFSGDAAVTSTSLLMHRTWTQLILLEQLIDRIRRLSEQTESHVDPIERQRHLSSIRVTHDQSTRLHHHSRIGFGRAFFDAIESTGDANQLPEKWAEDRAVWDEIGQLRRWLGAPETDSGDV